MLVRFNGITCKMTCFVDTGAAGICFYILIVSRTIIDCDFHLGFSLDDNGWRKLFLCMKWMHSSIIMYIHLHISDSKLINWLQLNLAWRVNTKFECAPYQINHKLCFTRDSSQTAWFGVHFFLDYLMMLLVAQVVQNRSKATCCIKVLNISWIVNLINMYGLCFMIC
jgi:hypothetical protein